MIKKIIFLLLLFILEIYNKKDISTFSNYEIIKQTKLEINFNIDFSQKVIHGAIKIYFSALEDGEVIILDTNSLKINSIIDSDTGELLDYILDEQYKLDALGTPLKIYKEFQKNENISLLIKFDTKEEGKSVNWLEPEQTFGKIYPYMFSQGESILNRELFPSQDTPSVKTPVSVSLTVIKPLLALNSGIYQGKIDNGDTVTYFYEQKVPIQSYLVAIAAGKIEERVLSERTKIYGEKEIVDLAIKEFENTEDFIQVIEAYTFPYLWGEYNLLVLPSSFPYGGMENPTLTFVTPSLIAGDKSQELVIAHEICHGWSGNLVTMSSWTDFWLNEGFDVFLQSKIIEGFTVDKDLAKLFALENEISLETEIKSIGESKSFSSLHPYLIGRHPDDSVSYIPYIKGFDFLYFLEKIVNSQSEIDLFRKILRQYFSKFKYQSIQYEDFKNLFIDTIKEELPKEKAEFILDQIDWVKWIEAPGLPPIKNDYSNKYQVEAENYYNKFINNVLPDNFKDIFIKWDCSVQVYFLALINDTLDDTQSDWLTNKLNLKEGYNYQIKAEYFMIALNYIKIFDDTIKNALIVYLGEIGRYAILRPLYVGFYKRDKDAALETFEKYKKQYHPITVRFIESDLRKLV